MGWAVVIRRQQEELLLAAAGGVLVVLTIAPLAFIAIEMMSSEAIRQAGRALSAPRTWTLFGSSMAFAAVVTGLALAIGLPLGVILGRSDLPGRGVALLLHVFPVFVPPFLLGLGWFHLLGRGGLIGSETAALLLFSWPGAVGVLALALTPIVTSLVAVGVQGIDPSLEEAAVLVGGARRAATRVLLPLARPAIALAALVVFSLTFSELGVPMFLRVSVYPAMVFSRLGGVDYAPGEAFALALPLVGVAAALLVIERRAAGRRSFSALGLRSREPSILNLRRWRPLAGAFTAVAVLLPLLPIGALAFRAVQARRVTDLTYWMGMSIGSSLQDAFLAATAVLVVAVFVGHAAARGRRGGAGLDAVGVLAFVMPASVLGVGLIAMWNRPTLQGVYGTSTIVVLALAARYGGIAIRTAAVSFSQGPVQLEEAAATTGARFLLRLRRILLPIHARGLATAWLLAVVFCLRDLETAVLLYPPGGEPLTVRIFTLEANGAPPLVAALSCVQIAMTALVLALGAILFLRRRA